MKAENIFLLIKRPEPLRPLNYISVFRFLQWICIASLFIYLKRFLLSEEMLQQGLTRNMLHVIHGCALT